jgi:hypothetical protein
MATYEISCGTDRGFNVKIVGDDGARQTMLGFPTREAAEAWIVEDQRRSPSPRPSRLRISQRGRRHPETPKTSRDGYDLSPYQ